MSDSQRPQGVQKKSRRVITSLYSTGASSWLFVLCSSSYIIRATFTTAFVAPSPKRMLNLRHYDPPPAVPTRTITTSTTTATRGGTTLTTPPTRSTQRLFAKRNRKTNGFGDDMNSWYDRVNENATPDKVFWEEMERQRLFNQLGGENKIPSLLESSNPMGGSTTMTTTTTMMSSSMASSTTSSSNSNNMVMPNLSFESSRKPPTMDQLRIADATLSEYTIFQVQNNWLNENLQSYFNQMATLDLEEDLSLDEETRRLEEQLEDLPDGYGTSMNGGEDTTGAGTAWRDNDDAVEPWEYWGDDDKEMVVDLDRANSLKVPEPPKDSEFYMDWDAPINRDEIAQEEAKFWNRMKNCQISSRRLQKASRSKKAKSFFQRPPNPREGYDRLWVAAIDYACFKSLVGNSRNYGVEFADNFGDFMDGVDEDGLYTIEDVAAYKARKVYEITGLPCIASRTSFEVEPIPPESFMSSVVSNGKGSGGAAAAAITNPKVLSGYKFNDIGNHVDYVVDALQPLSEPNRVTRFTSCLCYYDGEMEIFEHGVCDVDMIFCHSGRTFIPMAQAIHNMVETLKLTFGFEYQKWLKVMREDASMATGTVGPASLKLRDRVLRDARVLPNDIVDVSAFIDSKVDVNLMDICAKELAERFMKEKPTKILTIATTGLVIALPMAKYLQVPVVYARKERTAVMADTFQAGFASRTVGKNRELLVSKNHLDPEDRILIIDDFLSSGASQEALLRIISEADATAVGIGVLLEKSYESGRQSLSGFNIPIHSLCRVASVEGGTIQLVEEEGYIQK